MSQAQVSAGTTHALLFLHAQTSLHPGAGTAIGTVDLPVQRERHSGWPTIPGSSIKGVLRDTLRRSNGDPDDVFALFGPDSSQAEKYAGALSFTDARLLAFPVRSLKGVFAWISCPAALRRLQQDAQLAQISNVPATIDSVPADQCLIPENAVTWLPENAVVLEDQDFRVAGKADPWSHWIADNGVSDDASKGHYARRLVILHDDDFTYFVRHATEIVARIGLDYEKKTVRQGALFYQEFIPAEALFYSVAIAAMSRNPSKMYQANEVLSRLRDNLPRVIQIGGDETIGKGLCTLRLITG